MFLLHLLSSSSSSSSLFWWWESCRLWQHSPRRATVDTFLSSLFFDLIRNKQTQWNVVRWRRWISIRQVVEVILLYRREPQPQDSNLLIMAEHHGNCATAKRRSGQQEKKKTINSGKKKGNKTQRCSPSRLLRNVVEVEEMMSEAQCSVWVFGRRRRRRWFLLDYFSLVGIIIVSLSIGKWITIGAREEEEEEEKRRCCCCWSVVDQTKKEKEKDVGVLNVWAAEEEVEVVPMRPNLHFASIHGHYFLSINRWSAT